MKTSIFTTIATLVFCLSTQAQAHNPAEQDQLVLTSLERLEAVGAEPLSKSEDLELGFAFLTVDQQVRISEMAHEAGQCGGFEAFGPEVKRGSELENILGELTVINKKHDAYKKRPLVYRPVEIDYDEEIQDSVDLVDQENLRANVEWLSSFNSRCHSSPTANDHAHAMADMFEEWAASVDFPVQVELVEHRRTDQYSLRVSVEGSVRPDEIIVLGGHYDSINGAFFCGSRRAPGADDNASGSSNLIEILSILLEHGQPERTVQFMWYGAEEVGLVGSKEIASDYRSEGKDVIAVMQLDMTLQPGSGVGTIAFITDYTSPWLNEVTQELNRLYVNGNVVEDRCGYACSDHASWHRQDYHAVMPFEAGKGDMNSDIHTIRDIIDGESSFEHSAYFARLGVAFALTLGNSNIVPAY